MESRGWTRGSCIGKGSFGTVSLAYGRSDGESFAVKSVGLNSSSHPAAVTSLEKEIQILKSLHSPYVVSYLGDSTTRESCESWRNLHMEYIPGGTLAEMAITTPMTEADIRSYARCVVLALRYLHSVAGVVHSDVKGRNVLVGPAKGVAKIADFGSARRIGTADEQELIGGTPLWMAPEVARGEVGAPESDIWSLGCTVIEMATGGGHPWRSNCISCCDENQLVFRIGYGTELPEFPSRLSKQGQDFLDKCLRRNTGERWSAEKLLEHPFLADVLVNGDCVLDARPSPRSVLDYGWGNSELEDAFDDKEEVVMDNVRERIRDLASEGGGMLGWDWEDDDNWEIVRITCSEEEECVQYSDRCNVELEDCDANDGNEATCCSSCCSSCHCCCGSYCCKFGFSCQHVSRASRWSPFGCSSKILIPYFRVVNRKLLHLSSDFASISQKRS